MELVNGIIFMSLLEISTSSSALTTPLSINLIKQRFFLLTKLQILQFHVKDKTPLHASLQKKGRQPSTLAPPSLQSLFATDSQCNSRFSQATLLLLLLEPYLHFSAFNQVVLPDNNSPSNHPLYI